MATTSSQRQEQEPSLQPRIVDASDIDYSTAVAHVEPDETAYFERKAGQTNLVIR